MATAILAGVLGSWIACAALEADFPPITIVDQGPIAGRLYVPMGAVGGTGQTVSSAGDVNGDGSPDLLIGAFTRQDGEPGRVYVVPARSGGSFMRELAPGRGEITEIRSGSDVPDRLGSLVAPAGDVDGDGVDDFLVGMPAPGHPRYPGGAIFLVFGEDPLPAALDLSEELGRQAIVFTRAGSGSALLGTSGAAAGDINGDGFDDLLLGLPGAATSGNGGPRPASGLAWLIFGGADLRAGAAVVDLDSLTPARGLEIAGPQEGSELGASVAGLGDIDGDGIADCALGAPGHDLHGAVFLLFGSVGLDTAPDLTAPDGVSCVVLRGTIPGGRLGAAVQGGLQCTGETLPDLLLGAPGVRREDRVAGGAYLVPGGPALRGAPLTQLPTPETVLFRGIQDSGTGSSLALVPDVEGDGLAEVLLGAPGSRGGRGASYLIRGGREPGREIFLEDLVPPDGWTFLANSPGLRLGHSVAGLPDRNGDLLGDFAMGAPGLPRHMLPDVGGVFEVFLPQDPESPAPRNLRARILPGGRVELTWMISTPYGFLRIHRDGAPASPQLPGRALQFVDIAAGPGRHVYFVEADGNPELRSGQIEVELRPRAVEGLTCRQLEGGTTVEVEWLPGDIYVALQVFADGEPATDLLPPNATGAVLDLAPGEHVIEVRDPVSNPPGDPARCSLLVVAPDLPAIEGLTCSLEAPRVVRLQWVPDPAYDAYLIARNEQPLARVDDVGEFIDSGVPPGSARYEVRGLSRGLHRGPPAACEVEIEAEGPFLLTGRVGWGGGGEIRTGWVRALDAEGLEVSRAQVSAAGEFVVPVPAEGTYEAVYEATIDPSGVSFHQVFSGPLEIGVPSLLTAGVPAWIELPPPVVVVSSLGPRDIEKSAASHWSLLLEALGNRTLAFPGALPGGIARGAAFLDLRVAEIRAFLGNALGSEPPAVDIVAHGAAGLAVRAWAAGLAEPAIRRVILLGTPNLGTTRARVEARAEASSRPPRHLDALRQALRRGAESGAPRYSGAVEQTPEFLEGFHRAITRAPGSRVVLIAGTGGLSLLDPVLGCTEHDDRVCATSALGGIPGSTPFTVDEDHETLGRGSESLAVLVEELLPADGGEAGVEEGGAAVLPLETPEAEPAPVEEEPAGAGADFDGTYPTGDTYIGTLEAGDTGALPLVSDTSESIIIILNSDLPGGISFEVETPSGTIVDPPAAGALQAVKYQTYGDAEGHEIQAYEFTPCEPGTYTALLENPPDGVAVRYMLESYVAADFELEVEVLPETVDPGQPSTVLASLTRKDWPEPDAVLSVVVSRPDGEIELLDLFDDGQGTDQTAGDGIYSATIPGSSQPGIHQLEVSAVSPEAVFESFRREVTTWFQVTSDVATFTGDFDSGAQDTDRDGVLDSIWVNGSLEATEGGIFLVRGKLTDSVGNPVADTGVVFSLEGPATTGFRLFFDGADIHEARRDGPFVLAEVEILDGSAGFVRADYLTDAHTTSMMSWVEFGIAESEEYLRGDANTDGDIDISDGITMLAHLFLGSVDLECRDAANANNDGVVDISDASYLFMYLFLGGEPLPPPFPGCGSAEKLGCERYDACP